MSVKNSIDYIAVEAKCANSLQHFVVTRKQFFKKVFHRIHSKLEIVLVIVQQPPEMDETKYYSSPSTHHINTFLNQKTS